MRAPAMPLLINTFFAAESILSSVEASFLFLTIRFNQMVNEGIEI
jgi:hypothetical protein